MTVRPLRFEDGALLVLDQTLLPRVERWLTCESAADVADALLIREGSQPVAVQAGASQTTAGAGLSISRATLARSIE